MSTPTPSTALVTKGNMAARETNHALEETEDGYTGTFEIVGSLANVKTAGGRAAAYDATTGELTTVGGKVGTSVKVFGKTLQITKTELSAERGGTGKLKVTAAAEKKTEVDDPENPGQTVEVDSYRFEIDFSLQGKSLETLSRNGHDYAAMFETPASAACKALRRWKNIKSEEKYFARWAALEAPTEEAANKEGSADPAIDSDWETLSSVSALAAEYAGKVANGVEEYLVQVPVVRKVTTTRNAPHASTAGQRENLPSGAPTITGVGAWLKTGDSWTKDTKHGKWTRTEEWTGFASLDEDLYGSGS